MHDYTYAGVSKASQNRSTWKTDNPSLAVIIQEDVHSTVYKYLNPSQNLPTQGMIITGFLPNLSDHGPKKSPHSAGTTDMMMLLAMVICATVGCTTDSSSLASLELEFIPNSAHVLASYPMYMQV